MMSNELLQLLMRRRGTHRHIIDIFFKNMPERLRNCNTECIWSNDQYSFRISNEPELRSMCLFLPGSDRKKDEIILSMAFSSVEETDIVEDSIREGVRFLNASIQEAQNVLGPWTIIE